MAVDGCSEPLFTIATEETGDSLADIAVTVQRWFATADDSATSASSSDSVPSPSVSGTTASAGTSESDVVALPSTAEMTLAAAIRAAEDQSCKGCVEPMEPATAEESARLGLVNLGISDRPDGGGGGYDSTWGFDGTDWHQLEGTQDNMIMPIVLPDQFTICVDSNTTNLRSGPSTSSPVIDTITEDAQVTGTYFRLVSGFDRETWHQGSGWFEVSVNGARAWVSSERVSDDCDLWRNYPGFGDNA